MSGYGNELDVFHYCQGGRMGEESGVDGMEGIEVSREFQGGFLSWEVGRWIVFGNLKSIFGNAQQVRGEIIFLIFYFPCRRYKRLRMR